MVSAVDDMCALLSRPCPRAQRLRGGEAWRAGGDAGRSRAAAGPERLSVGSATTSVRDATACPTGSGQRTQSLSLV